MYHAYLYLANTDNGNRVILAENVPYKSVGHPPPGCTPVTIPAREAP